MAPLLLCVRQETARVRAGGTGEDPKGRRLRLAHRQRLRVQRRSLTCQKLRLERLQTWGGLSRRPSAALVPPTKLKDNMQKNQIVSEDLVFPGKKSKKSPSSKKVKFTVSASK